MAELVDRSDLVEMTARIVSAYLVHNPVPVAEMPRLIKLVGAQIATLESR